MPLDGHGLGVCLRLDVCLKLSLREICMFDVLLGSKFDERCSLACIEALLDDDGIGLLRRPRRVVVLRNPVISSSCR